MSDNPTTADRVWAPCWNCEGEGVIDEGDCTCGEDTCCCLSPEPPICCHCAGRGGLYVASDSVGRV